MMKNPDMTTGEILDGLPQTRLDMAIAEIRCGFALTLGRMTAVGRGAIEAAAEVDRLKAALCDLSGQGDSAAVYDVDSAADHVRNVFEEYVAQWRALELCVVDTARRRYADRARLLDALRLERVLRRRMAKLEGEAVTLRRTRRNDED